MNFNVKYNISPLFYFSLLMIDLNKTPLSLVPPAYEIQLHCNTKLMLKCHFKTKHKPWIFIPGKSKRWKNLYFILEGNNSQLIYFESEKRATKPKGLIDLSVCTVYGVHDSLFGRWILFMNLILKALCMMGFFYIPFALSMPIVIIMGSILW